MQRFPHTVTCSGPLLGMLHTGAILSGMGPIYFPVTSIRSASRSKLPMVPCDRPVVTSHDLGLDRGWTSSHGWHKSYCQTEDDGVIGDGTNSERITKERGLWAKLKWPT